MKIPDLLQMIIGFVLAVIVLYVAYRKRNGVKQKVRKNGIIYTRGLYEGKRVYSENDSIKTATIEILKQRRLDAKTAIRQAEIESINEMIKKDDARELIRKSKKRKP